MPQHLKPLSPSDGPLAEFALALRRMRDQAPADRPTRPEEIARLRVETEQRSKTTTSRASIYKALAGTSLPSRDTLTVMVYAWAPRRLADVPEWMQRRTQCDTELARRATNATVNANGRTEDAAHANVHLHRRAHDTINVRDSATVDVMPAAQLERTTLSSNRDRDGVQGSTVVNEKAQQFLTEIIRLYRQAGSPPLRTMAEQADNQVSYTTFANLLQGQRLPSENTLHAFFKAVSASTWDTEKVAELYRAAASTRR